MGISRADLRMHRGRSGRRMRAALEGGGLQKRFSVKDGLASTLLRTSFKALLPIAEQKQMLLVKADYLKTK